MNRFQKLCLLISILGCLDFALNTLLHMSFIMRFLPDSGLWYKSYAFLIGVCGFCNLTLFSNKQ
ncbi:MAG: hypothetical protein HFG16_00905 [Erysipelotrichaceae bacterium]|nr:hypothetical protein [Erysipelotrichaceae bacterium]